MTNNKAEIIKLEFGGLLNFATKKSYLREVLLFQGVNEESVYLRAFNKKWSTLTRDTRMINPFKNKPKKKKRKLENECRHIF